MAGGKLTPRQRMINMMYLVLTAMLALNVSAEVLDAFVKIEQGLQQTSVISKEKNEQTLAEFAKAAVDNKEKVEPWQKKALLVDEKAKELAAYIQALKLELIKKGDGEETKGIVDGKVVPEDINAKENTDAVNEIMIGAQLNGKAYDLKNKIEEYKKLILSDVISETEAPGLVAEINGILNFEFKKNGLADERTWETFTFEGIPLMSAVAMLTKIQVDVQNTESSLYAYLMSQIGKEDFKFTNIVAVVKPITSSAVLKGSEFEAQVFLGAYDPNQKFTAKLNVGSFESDASGKITIKRRVDAIGMQNINGKIIFTGPKGSEEIDVKFDYQVIEPNLVVSPSKMNVFYLGIENPVDISVAGVPMEKINVNISNSEWRKQDKGFVIKPKELKNCEISVTADINGTTQSMGTRIFRVKRVPPPTAKVFGVDSKMVDKGMLASAQGVVAQMPSDFDFDLKYTVKSFTLGTTVGGYFKEQSSTGQTFTEAQRNLIAGVQSGQLITIREIKAVGPDGLTIDLGDIILKVR